MYNSIILLRPTPDYIIMSNTVISTLLPSSSVLKWSQNCFHKLFLDVSGTTYWKIKKYMYTNAIINIIFGKRRILIPESSEKILSYRWKSWTHDPSSSSLGTPTTEPLEALRQTGLKFNYYYKDSDVFFPTFY